SHASLRTTNARTPTRNALGVNIGAQSAGRSRYKRTTIGQTAVYYLARVLSFRPFCLLARHSYRAAESMSTDSILDEYPLPKRKIRWVGLVFFVLLHAVALIGTPLYIYYRGVTGPELALFAFFLVATGLSTTIGYHRLFAHGTFETSPVV